METTDTTTADVKKRGSVPVGTAKTFSVLSVSPKAFDAHSTIFKFDGEEILLAAPSAKLLSRFLRSDLMKKSVPLWKRGNFQHVAIMSSAKFTELHKRAST